MMRFLYFCILLNLRNPNVVLYGNTMCTNWSEVDGFCVIVSSPPSRQMGLESKSN